MGFATNILNRRWMILAIVFALASPLLGSYSWAESKDSFSESSIEPSPDTRLFEDRSSPCYSQMLEYPAFLTLAGAGTDGLTDLARKRKLELDAWAMLCHPASVISGDNFQHIESLDRYEENQMCAPGKPEARAKKIRSAYREFADDDPEDQREVNSRLKKALSITRKACRRLTK